VNRGQRVALVVYCSLLVYCVSGFRGASSIAMSYVSESDTAGFGPVPSLGATIFDRITEASILPPPAGFTLESSEPTWERARPDVELIILRLIAATGIGAALYCACPHETAGLTTFARCQAHFPQFGSGLL